MGHLLDVIQYSVLQVLVTCNTNHFSYFLTRNIHITCAGTLCTITTVPVQVVPDTSYKGTSTKTK